MLLHNKKMQDFLRQNGVFGITAKYIFDGSLKQCWRLYRKTKEGFSFWNIEEAEKLNSLGFTDLRGKPLGQFSGNGGRYQVFVRGHNELLS